MNNRLRPILLADDSENDVELTIAALTANNLANRVVVARNGAEALEYLTGRGAELPVVVLLDLNMPKVSGLEALSAIKADPRLKDIPVVMLTSSREGPDVEESYRLGANAYVVKPVDFNQFFDAVKVVGAFWGLMNEPPVARAGSGEEEPPAKGT